MKLLSILGCTTSLIRENQVESLEQDHWTSRTLSTKSSLGAHAKHGFLF